MSNPKDVKIYKRIMELDIPEGQSVFIWGARETGKSTYLRQKFPESIYYDLLNTDVLHRLRLKPSLLREELRALPDDKKKLPIIIDEVQKVPDLLNEVHWLIENEGLGFILCGSSARKLKRGAANLLGGRAWKFNFYPLVFPEVTNFDLLKVLNQGLIPPIYHSAHIQRSFKAYVDLYLKEEIQAEGLVRNLPGFARFLDLVGYSNGELLNYNKIATDCGVDAKTVKEYYQILMDTNIGYYVDPFILKPKRQVISSTPKFYLFDVGIGTYLTRQRIEVLKGEAAGKAFEHYILMELMAYVGIHEVDTNIQYWRSKTGLEVDFILQRGEVALEIKISDAPRGPDLKGLKAYIEDYHPNVAGVVCMAPKKRVLDSGIVIYPWKTFLKDLWAGKVF